MNGKFVTEKQGEELLELEEGYILFPDGSRQRVSAFRLYWDALEHILASDEFSETDLATYAEMHAQDTGKSYKDAYLNIVAYVNKKLRKHQGIDE